MAGRGTRGRAPHPATGRRTPCGGRHAGSRGAAPCHGVPRRGTWCGALPRGATPGQGVRFPVSGYRTGQGSGSRPRRRPVEGVAPRNRSAHPLRWVRRRVTGCFAGRAGAARPGCGDRGGWQSAAPEAHRSGSDVRRNPPAGCGTPSPVGAPSAAGATPDRGVPRRAVGCGDGSGGAMPGQASAAVGRGHGPGWGAAEGAAPRPRPAHPLRRVPRQAMGCGARQWGAAPGHGMRRRAVGASPATGAAPGHGVRAGSCRGSVATSGGCGRSRETWPGEPSWQRRASPTPGLRAR